MATIEQMIEMVMAHAGGRPMWEVMRDDERALGHEVVLPGERDWFRAEDWDPTVTVSITSRGEVRLVAILAAEPGRGAFRRLAAAIVDAGLTPVIIAPTNAMRCTVKRWGWAVRHVGAGWNHEEQWRPRKNRRPASAELNRRLEQRGKAA